MGTLAVEEGIEAGWYRGPAGRGEESKGDALILRDPNVQEMDPSFTTGTRVCTRLCSPRPDFWKSAFASRYLPRKCLTL